MDKFTARYEAYMDYIKWLEPHGRGQPGLAQQLYERALVEDNNFKNPLLWIEYLNYTVL